MLHDVAAGQGHHPHSVFVPFLSWFSTLLTESEEKPTEFKADLPALPLERVCTAPVPCRHFLYGLTNGKAGLAGGRAPADPCLPSFPLSDRSRTLTGTLGEDFVVEISW